MQKKKKTTTDEEWGGKMSLHEIYSYMKKTNQSCSLLFVVGKINWMCIVALRSKNIILQYSATERPDKPKILIQTSDLSGWFGSKWGFSDHIRLFILLTSTVHKMITSMFLAGCDWLSLKMYYGSELRIWWEWQSSHRSGLWSGLLWFLSVFPLFSFLFCPFFLTLFFHFL